MRMVEPPRATSGLAAAWATPVARSPAAAGPGSCGFGSTDRPRGKGSIGMPSACLIAGLDAILLSCSGPCVPLLALRAGSPCGGRRCPRASSWRHSSSETDECARGVSPNAGDGAGAARALPPGVGRSPIVAELLCMHPGDGELAFGVDQLVGKHGRYGPPDFYVPSGYVAYLTDTVRNEVEESATLRVCGQADSSRFFCCSRRAAE